MNVFTRLIHLIATLAETDTDPHIVLTALELDTAQLHDLHDQCQGALRRCCELGLHACDFLFDHLEHQDETALPEALTLALYA